MSVPLTLSTGDQRRLVAASTALLSPLAYPDADAWRRDVCDLVRELLGADRIIFVLPRDGKADLFTEDYDPAIIAEYADQIRPVADSFRMFDRLRAIGAGTRPMLYDDMDAFYRSPYWNEYARPQGAFDSLTASVPVGPSPTLAHHAQLLANKNTPHAVPFGDHEVGLARLLLPALQTGALAWQRLEGARDAFTVFVDTLGIGAFVFDAGGVELHRNPAASRLLGADPDGLATVASQVARALARPGPDGPPSPVCSGHFVVRAVPLAAEVAGRGGLSLVTVEPAESTTSSSIPAAESLCKQLGLTRQQSRVALLLADRRSTAEIAGALSISIHTVRRHIEAVLERLGVPSRVEVEGALRRAAADADRGRRAYRCCDLSGLTDRHGGGGRRVSGEPESDLRRNLSRPGPRTVRSGVLSVICPHRRRLALPLQLGKNGDVLLAGPDRTDGHLQNAVGQGSQERRSLHRWETGLLRYRRSTWGRS